MINLVGKTVKIKGYDGRQVVGVFVRISKLTKLGMFVGYENNGNVSVGDIKVYHIKLKEKGYNNQMEYDKSLKEGKILVDPKDISGSRMPRGVGNYVRERAKQLQRELDERDGDIEIKVNLQEIYRKEIERNFFKEVKRDPDLSRDSFTYDEGEIFLRTKGFYYIKKDEVKGMIKEEIEKLTDITVEYLSIFIQTSMGGSMADYYATAMETAFKGYYLYVDFEEFDAPRFLRETIEEFGVSPNDIYKKVNFIKESHKKIKIKKVR